MVEPIRFSQSDVVSDADVARAARVVRSLGIPEAWTKTVDFRRNLERMFVAVGPRAKQLMLAAATFGSAAAVEAMSERSAALTGLQTLRRTFLLAALDQPNAVTTPAERYSPIDGFVPSCEPGWTDLTALSERFFFDHGDDEVAAASSLQKALAAIEPEVVAIGSGPGTAAALDAIYAKRPKTRALVLEMGDYYRQEEYDALSPWAASLETYKQGAAMVIVNGASRASVNLAAQVWGGGAEIFSGTAHALPDWYRPLLPMSAADADRHETAVRRDCRVAETPWAILNDAQKIFFRAAESLGHRPYLLDGFGRGADSGNGRCYAGKKGRIPYLDRLFAAGHALVGVANCRVDALWRAPNGTAAAIDLTVLSRRTRQALCTYRLELPAGARVILGAGSLGDQRILQRSGDPAAVHPRPRVIHQYSCEVAALFDEPLSSNGIPQGIALQVLPDEREAERVIPRVLVEGGHPGRAVLTALGLPCATDRLHAFAATPRMGTVGILFTERTPGLQQIMGETAITLQRLVPEDFRRANRALEATMRIWEAAGARGIALNHSVPFRSRDAELARAGFASMREIPDVVRHIARHPPAMQVFYRMGNRFGTTLPGAGEVPGFGGVHLVGEDVLPPGPGVNPTLALMMVARHYGEAIAGLLR